VITHVWGITLTVSDLQKAVRFYGDVLGLTRKYQFSDYAGFDCGGVEIGVKTWGELDQARQGEPCIDLAVDDVDEMYKDLLEKGVAFLKEPEEAQWGAKIALLKDPDGNVLQLTQTDWKKYFAVSAPR
jgi:catechol 2,3-dioxygenase-like lactoylglutathione lyase family enzyme